jgi:hypothetical protein
MRYRGVMIVQVYMSRAVAMSVCVSVVHQHRRFAPQWRIERIVGRIDIRVIVSMPAATVVLMLIVCMRVLDKPGLVGVRVASIVDGHRNVEAMRLRDLLQRFPVGTTVRHHECLLGAVATFGFTRMKSAPAPVNRNRGGTPSSKIDTLSVP